jgi:hypothetical protein
MLIRLTDDQIAKLKFIAVEQGRDGDNDDAADIQDLLIDQAAEMLVYELEIDADPSSQCKRRPVRALPATVAGLIFTFTRPSAVAGTRAMDQAAPACAGAGL